MAVKTFSIELDESVKAQMDAFCAKMGITTDAAFNMFASKVVMDRRIPFDIADNGSLYEQWMTEQLAQRTERAEGKETAWYSHDEFWQKAEEL